MSVPYRDIASLEEMICKLQGRAINAYSKYFVVAGNQKSRLVLTSDQHEYVNKMNIKKN